MLKSADEISDILLCPASGDRLTKYNKGSTIIYSSLSQATHYQTIHQLPVLIDFGAFLEDEHSFFKRQAASAIQRAEFGQKKRSILKKLVSNPLHATKSNMELLYSMLKNKGTSATLLIIGGGERGYYTDVFYDDLQIGVVAFDIYYSENLTFIADAHKIPLKNASVDAVIIQAVLEHVLEPTQVVAEIYRVLKPNGLVYAETPFMQPVHEGAFDFTRFSESGHRYLFKHFEEVRAGAACGAGTNLMWSIEYLFRGLFRSKAAGKLAKLLFFWVKYFDYLIDERYTIDAANGVYFLGKKSENIIDGRYIISRYKGAY